MNVRKKRIIVTGAGSGVGRKLALKLLEKGASVLAVDISREALDETVKHSGNHKKLFTYVVDISNKDAVFSFVDQAIIEHKKIDGVINNAGIIQPFVHLNELDFERIERVMNINFYGTLYMIKALLPHLMKRPKAHIVNVSSMGGFLPVPGQSVYGASKAAVKLLSEGLYSELKNTNVKVTVIIPGGMATNIKKNSNVAQKSSDQSNKNSKLILTADEAADLILNAMEKDRLRVYIGKDCKLMNALYKLSPSMAMGMINRVMGSREH